ATLNLGNAYNTSTFGGANGDLVFKFGVANGGLITAPVNYVTSALAGDYNHNGVVDAADYVLWRKTLNQAGAGLPADGNGNGVVDQADYNIWRANFGKPGGSGAGAGIAASVPEPTALTLMLLSGLYICGRRGHRFASDVRGDC